jgi:hypothetical protein
MSAILVQRVGANVEPCTCEKLTAAGYCWPSVLPRQRKFCLPPPTIRCPTAARRREADCESGICSNPHARRDRPYRGKLATGVAVWFRFSSKRYQTRFLFLKSICIGSDQPVGASSTDLSASVSRL